MRRIPKLCRRKDGRLYVTDPATGRQVPLADEAAYGRWVADFAGRPERPAEAPPRASVEQLIDAYHAHAAAWYTKRGKPTSHQRLVASVAREVRACWGATRDAGSIRGPDLEALQRRLAAAGLARGTVNAYVRKAVEIWRWGVGKDAVDPAALQRLEAVPGLKRGRSAARDRPRVRPADPADVEAALASLRPPAADMVRLQQLGGCRPGEICALRPCDVDRSAAVWVYHVPGDWDKTEHRKEDEEDRPRRVYFGPRAQAVLGPLLDAAADPAAPLFRGRGGRPLNTESYGARIEAACEAAGVPVFRPNRLRHSRGTDVRRVYGIEGARVYLGHEDAGVTEIYAERDESLARRIAEETG